MVKTCNGMSRVEKGMHLHNFDWVVYERLDFCAKGEMKMSITLVGESVTTYSNDLSLKGFIRNKKLLKPLGVTHTSLLVEKCGEF